MKPSTMLTVALLTSAATLATVCEAKQEYVARLPNGANVSGIKALGHTDTTGKDDATNAFGKAFKSAGLKWTTSLCQADTDGDGQTNGQELGDPCCEWSQGGTPRYSEGLSHPSDKTSMANASLWESISCAPIAASASPSTHATSPYGILVGAVAGLALGLAARGNQ